MEVTFTRTGHRRYAVRAERALFAPVEMNPAPGFDPYLPHDLVHFVVESELGLTLGIFGQLSAGGDAGTFHLPPSKSASRDRTRTQRRIRRRGASLVLRGRLDAEFSERAASICHFEWLRRSSLEEHRAAARVMAPYIHKVLSGGNPSDQARLSAAAIQRICARLDEVSREWCRLGEGQSLTFRWEQHEKGVTKAKAG